MVASAHDHPDEADVAAPLHQPHCVDLAPQLVTVRTKHAKVVAVADPQYHQGMLLLLLLLVLVLVLLLLLLLLRSVSSCQAQQRAAARQMAQAVAWAQVLAHEWEEML